MNLNDRFPVSKRQQTKARKVAREVSQSRMAQQQTAAQIMGATRERLSLRPSHHDEKSTRHELRHWSKPGFRNFQNYRLRVRVLCA